MKIIHNNVYKAIFFWKNMKIENEQDMDELCSSINSPVDIKVKCNLSNREIGTWIKRYSEMISEGYLKPNEMPQGIIEMNYNLNANRLDVFETPCVFPSPDVLKNNPEHTRPMTGVLVNAFDPEAKTFLYHLRGGEVDNPWSLQVTAAGFVRFNKKHYETAVNVELKEEEGSSKVIPILGKKAFGVFPFMKNGIPQPLSAFGFLYDSSISPKNLYPVLSSLDEISEFEERTKDDIKSEKLKPREAHHFHIPLANAQKIVGQIYDPTEQGKNGGFFWTYF